MANTRDIELVELTFENVHHFFEQGSEVFKKTIAKGFKASALNFTDISIGGNFFSDHR